MNENLKDIIDCIIRFDDTESIEAKGRYFDVIQKDLRKEVNNVVLFDAITRCDFEENTECKNQNIKYTTGHCVNCGGLAIDL
tara:strand:- start:1030 stop:1275 length:246 start_codon:yes stop_codon:yes gene_type:complete